MRKTYDIYYNDGAYYGTIAFTNKTQSEIKKTIEQEILDNNKNANKDYHISRKSFQERIG